METNKNYKILLVDDQQINLQLLGSLLRGHNYNVGVAMDGKQALDILTKSSDYDLVLLDVNMPGMNGFKVCKAMRKQESLREIPVIFLTALEETESIVNGFEAGGQDYVTKPFNAIELLARVNTHLELKKSKDKLKMVNKMLEEKVAERTKELQQTNDNLETANRELETLDMAKSEFLHIIGHEINTPLNGIIGFISLLKDEVKTTELYEYVHNIDESAQRLLSFARISLQITELRTKKETLKKVYNHLGELLMTVKNDTANELKAKEIELSIERDVSQTNILGDKELILFCFKTILLNSVKHSKNNSAITIKIDPDNEKTVCSFIDQGKGFSPYALKNLFKLFSTGKDHIDGNDGLDLSLVKIIMDIHHGEIEVQNNQTSGATVRLTFYNNNI